MKNNIQLNNDLASDILNSLRNDGKVTDAEMTEIMNMTKKQKIDSVHKYAIREKFNKDGSFQRYITDLPEKSPAGKRIEKSSKTLDGLYDALYDYYFPSMTLDRLFDEWQDYSKNHTSRSKKTASEDYYIYQRFLKDKPITKKDIRKLTVGDFMRYFDDLFIEIPSKHNVSSVRSLIKRLYEQAIRDNINVRLPLDGIDFKNRRYKLVDNIEKVYTEEERIKLLTYLLSKPNPTNYDRAIIFMFCFTIRVGELKGLQWDDVDMDRREIYIHQQLNSEDKLDEIKKQRETGHRRLAMPDIAYDVLNTVEPHLRSGFVFTNNDAPLTTDGFNDTLKRRCDAVGIRYLSSHKIRFANCVLMLENGVPLYEAQKAMGHANQAMTEHYNRVLQKRANQDIKLVFNDALNNVRNVSAS